MCQVPFLQYSTTRLLPTGIVDTPRWSSRHHIPEGRQDQAIPGCAPAPLPAAVQAITPIDEVMVGFRGHFGSTQYMPQKPTKWGIKAFTMAGTQTLDRADPAYHSLPQPACVVMDLMGQYISRQGILLFTDRYRNTQKLWAGLIHNMSDSLRGGERLVKCLRKLAGFTLPGPAIMGVNTPSLVYAAPRNTTVLAVDVKILST